VSKLTDQQELFVVKYLESGFDREKAALAAGYSKANWASIVSRLLQKPQVKAKIDQFFDSQVEKTTIEAGEIVQSLRRIALAPVSARVTNSDRIRACEVLAKILGLTRDGLAVGVNIDNSTQQMNPADMAELAELARLNNLRLAGCFRTHNPGDNGPGK
jgi:phage terminase small subunit